MYFSIFIVMYLAINYSNGFLFINPPFQENGELNDESKNIIIKLFDRNNQFDSISNEGFTRLLEKFKWLHHMEYKDINKLYKDEVQYNRTITTKDGFLRPMTECIKIIESLYTSRYNNSLNEEKKMTLNELKKALVVKELHLTEEVITTLITDYKFTNEQDISKEEFRKTFVLIMYNQIYTIPIEDILIEIRGII